MTLGLFASGKLLFKILVAACYFGMTAQTGGKFRIFVMSDSVIAADTLVLAAGDVMTAFGSTPLVVRGGIYRMMAAGALSILVIGMLERHRFLRKPQSEHSFGRRWMKISKRCSVNHDDRSENRCDYNVFFHATASRQESVFSNYMELLIIVKELLLGTS